MLWRLVAVGGVLDVGRVVLVEVAGIVVVDGRAPSSVVVVIRPERGLIVAVGGARPASGSEVGRGLGRSPGPWRYQQADERRRG